MRVLRLLLITTVILVGRSDAALLRMRCDLSEPGEPYVRRVPPASYPSSYPFCVSQDANSCIFGFCPSLTFVVACNLNPHCEASVAPCTLSSDGEFFPVKRGERRRMRANGDRVILRCVK